MSRMMNKNEKRSTKMNDTWYGWYSQLAHAVGCPVWRCQSLDGGFLRITCKTRQEGGEGYQWDDKVAAGPVGHTLAQVSGRRPRYF